MATILYHPECFHKFFKGNPRVYNVKYRGKCAARTECLKNGLLEVGSPFVFGVETVEMLRKRLREENTNSVPDDAWRDAYNISENEIETSTEVDAAQQDTKQREESIKKIRDQILNKLNFDLEKMVKPEVGRLVSENIQSIAKQELMNISQSAKILIQNKIGALDKLIVETEKHFKELEEKLCTPTKIEIKFADTGETKNVGIQHKQFPILLKALAARCNVWLAGPSGSGKTTAAMSAAKALNLPFQYTGAVGDPYALMGYKDANGKYVRTSFREAWEHGGVFLWDEVDASDPNALLAFNAALANGTAPFPDGCIPKHENCLLIAAANTYGHGATHEYVGRLKMDVAFLKRFAFINWEYDEDMELATAPNKQWTKRVQEVRNIIKQRGLRVLVTPRESYIGAQLLAAGIPQELVEEMTIRSGMTQDQWDEISRKNKKF